MATVEEIVETQQQIRLSLVDWRTYSRLLRAFQGRRDIRLTYDRGELEIMSPLRKHERIGRILARLIETLTEELGLPIEGAKSTTLRRRKKKRGLEPDDCFWIANEPSIRAKDTLDLRVDPPPDLALETDMTSSSMNRMEIYAALGIPEVWRYENETLTFYRLMEGKHYQESATSLAFPLVTPEDLTRMLAQRHKMDQNALVRHFREWVREKIQNEKQSR
ncbi:MAG: Uma2 family endonuclease [Gemmataceae bacterium]